MLSESPKCGEHNGNIIHYDGTKRESDFESEAKFLYTLSDYFNPIENVQSDNAFSWTSVFHDVLLSSFLTSASKYYSSFITLLYN